MREWLASLVVPPLHRAADAAEDAADRVDCWARPRPPGLHTCRCWHWRRAHRRWGQCRLCSCDRYRTRWLNIAGRYRPMKESA